MTQHQKALEKLCAKPPPTDVSWRELKSVLEHLGYDMLTNSGSRRKFVHRESRALIICHEPHPNSIVHRACVVDVVEHLKNQGLI
jgi:predicted RNA binding protein YcfA (HicA-like mRNA interferase family)